MCKLYTCTFLAVLVNARHAQACALLAHWRALPVHKLGHDVHFLACEPLGHYHSAQVGNSHLHFSCCVRCIPKTLIFYNSCKILELHPYLLLSIYIMHCIYSVQEVAGALNLSTFYLL